MKIKILLTIFSFFSSFAMAYEDKMLNLLESNPNKNVVIDVVSFDKDNPNRHYIFAEKVAKKYPERKFYFMYHGNATYNTIKIDVLKEKNPDIKLIDSEFINKYSNIDFFVCKVGLKKKGFEIKDVYLNRFDPNYTSVKFIKEMRTKGYMILEEKRLRK